MNGHSWREKHYNNVEMEINLLTTKFSHRIETGQFICKANQWTVFYMSQLIVNRWKTSNKMPTNITTSLAKKLNRFNGSYIYSYYGAVL